MNFKQRFTYMLIGSLFTLAGYFLATLANNQPPNAHAQDNTTKVFDKIVCKELEVVNEDGKRIVWLSEFDSVGGLFIYNKDGERTVCLGDLIGDGVSLQFYNKEGDRVVDLGSGTLFLANDDDGTLAVQLGAFLGSGTLRLYNLDGKSTVKLDGLGGTLRLCDDDGNVRLYTAD